MRLWSTFIFIFLFSATGLEASTSGARKVFQSKRGPSKYILMAEELVKEGLYFSSVPFVKEYLTRSKNIRAKKVDAIIDAIVTNVGVRQFEVLPEKVLVRTDAPSVKYILAKKLFRDGRYSKSLQALRGLDYESHPVGPFALMLKASIYSLRGKQKTAILNFKKCEAVSEDQISDTGNKNRQRQLEINRDICVAGIARAYFANKQHEEAYSAYLDLPKSSHIWPEILFEEAWNSFYLRDFNRTLGKLVTYKAPVLDFIFNPEIEILRALTYLELCLYGDAKQVVENFYDKYQKEAAGLKRFLNKYGKRYKAFYLLAKRRKKGKVPGNSLVNVLLNDVTRDPAYRELYNYFTSGKKELKKLKAMQRSRFRSVLGKNLKEALILQRDLIGAYTRKKLHLFQSQMFKSFQDMSYIKLEVLTRRKEALYGGATASARTRGDIRNLQKTDKQYFWTFNGEFWADELGDYVFSLKSQCK